MRPKLCGKEGRVFRSTLRDLVQGREVDPWRAHTAVFHIERCDYCQLDINQAIRGAREEGHRTDYLESVLETLSEARKKLETLGIKGERQIV